MKKLLLVIALLLTFTLLGCRSNNEPKLSIEGWVIHYVVEKYEETGYELLATKIYELDIVNDVDIETNDYDYAYFKVEVYSNEGSLHTYLTFIVYNEPLLLKHFFEEDIIDVEIEEAQDV